MNIQFMYNIAARIVHKLCLVVVTISIVKAQIFIFFTLLLALIVGLVYLEMSRLVTGSHSPQSPIPRVSTNKPSK